MRTEKVGVYPPGAPDAGKDILVDLPEFVGGKMLGQTEHVVADETYPILYQMDRDTVAKGDKKDPNADGQWPVDRSPNTPLQNV